MTGAGLDLDKDQRFPVPRHQVELAEGRPDVGADDLISETSQVVGCEGLAAKPERIDWRRPQPRALRESGSR